MEAARLGAMREQRGMVRSTGLRRPSLPPAVLARLADQMITSGPGAAPQHPRMEADPVRALKAVHPGHPHSSW